MYRSEIDTFYANFMGTNVFDKTCRAISFEDVEDIRTRTQVGLFIVISAEPRYANGSEKSATQATTTTMRSMSHISIVSLSHRIIRNK